jgi:hypothetical protein
LSPQPSARLSFLVAMASENQDDAGGEQQSWPLSRERLVRFDPAWASAGFFILVTAALLWAGWTAAGGKWGAALAMAAVAGFAAALLVQEVRVPSLFRLAFVAAAFANAAGYAAALWVESTPFDEAVHAFTSWAVAAGLTWVLFGRTRLLERGDRVSLFVTAVATGATLGILWEAFELVTGMINTLEDTVVDLLMDLTGAAAAGAFLAWAASQSSRKKG